VPLLRPFRRRAKGKKARFSEQCKRSVSYPAQNEERSRLQISRLTRATVEAGPSKLALNLLKNSRDENAFMVESLTANIGENYGSRQ